MEKGMEKDKRQEALKELYKQTEELYDSYENKEEFWNDQHWINNSLITLPNKIAMLEEQVKVAFENGRKHERELIRKRLREEIDANQRERVAMTDPDERSSTFLFIAGMNMALMITRWVEHVETN
jgi:hypothetical protein